MLMKAHLASLHPFVCTRPRIHARALLLGTGRSFARATHSGKASVLINTSNLENSPVDENPHDHHSLSSEESDGIPHEDRRALFRHAEDACRTSWWTSRDLLRLREDGDYGDC